MCDLGSGAYSSGSCASIEPDVVLRCAGQFSLLASRTDPQNHCRVCNQQSSRASVAQSSVRGEQGSHVPGTKCPGAINHESKAKKGYAEQCDLRSELMVHFDKLRKEYSVEQQRLRICQRHEQRPQEDSPVILALNCVRSGSARGTRQCLRPR